MIAKQGRNITWILKSTLVLLYLILPTLLNIHGSTAWIVTPMNTIRTPWTHLSSTLDVYVLKKRRPGCTGMFWRADPSGKLPLASQSENWPRDNAKIRGTVVECKGEKWLQATQVQQEKSLFESGEWKDAPKNAFMPFEYDNHYYLEKAQ